MSSPCSNCGCDIRACMEYDCDIYNGQYIERSKIDKAIEEINRANNFNYPSYTSAGLELALEIIRKNIGE